MVRSNIRLTIRALIVRVVNSESQRWDAKREPGISPRSLDFELSYQSVLSLGQGA